MTCGIPVMVSGNMLPTPAFVCGCVLQLALGAKYRQIRSGWIMSHQAGATQTSI